MIREIPDRELGMGRGITRRDFLNGVAVALTGAYAAAKTQSPIAAAAASQAPANSADYPPALTGLRGQYPSAVAEFSPAGILASALDIL